MRKSLGRPLFLYPLSILVILTWWTLAFTPWRTKHPSPISLETVASEPILHPHLRPLNRNEIQEGLRGNRQRMVQLMAEWDAEAAVLQAEGLVGVQRLSPHQLLRALRLEQSPAEAKHNARPLVVDDLGVIFPATQEPPKRFLPHTELAASILLAIHPPEQIVAIPARMRSQTLFPKSLLDAISLDIDRHNSEKLFLLHPDLAFVSHFTQGSAIQTMTQQGILLFTTTRMHSYTDVMQGVRKIGQVTGKPNEAELLAIFMEAGMCAVDNHLLAQQQMKAAPQNILYLNYYTSFSVPSEQHLTGQLLEKLGINRCVSQKGSAPWQIPLEVEQIANLKPDRIIIATHNPDSLYRFVLHHPALAQTPAVLNGQIYTVDEAIQDSPSQFLLLAYYDLAAVLLQERQDGR